MPKRKASSPVITTDQWLEELFRSPDPVDDGYLSVVEISERTGRSIHRIRRELQKAQRQNALLTRQRACMSIANTYRSVPVYKVFCP